VAPVEVFAKCTINGVHPEALSTVKDADWLLAITGINKSKYRTTCFSLTKGIRSV
jgi:hypothetical protein